MPCPSADLVIQQGSDEQLPFAVKQAPDYTQPKPVTGGKLWFTAKRSRMDPDAQAIIRKSWDNGNALGIVVTDDTQGVGYIRIDHTDLDAVAGSDLLLYYDLQFLDAGDTGELNVVAIGVLSVQTGVLRAPV